MQRTFFNGNYKKQNAKNNMKDNNINKYAKVSLPVPLDRSFTYSVPDHLNDVIHFGSRVLVSFGSRYMTGYCTGFAGELTKEEKSYKIKPVLDVLDKEKVFDKRKLKFFTWLKDYYFSSLGEALSLMHGPGLTKGVKLFYEITEKGRQELKKNELIKREKILLENLDKKVSIDYIVKKLKIKSPTSLLINLKLRGLVDEEIVLKDMKGKRFEISYKTIDKEADLKRTPAVEKLFLFLCEKENITPEGIGLDDIKEKFPANYSRLLKTLKEKNIIIEIKKEKQVNALDDIVLKDLNHKPLTEQQKAIDEINKSLHEAEFKCFLLYGVTGSGKTLVYARAIEKALVEKKRALFLVPEISLTGLAASSLLSLFKDDVALIHSSLTEAERYSEWRKIVSGKARVIIGARSALFTPVKDLGLIIVDEEHDQSYKQEEGIKYNGRDAAIVLAKTLSIPIVLGSATPSIESFYNSKTNKYKMLTLKTRTNEMPLPKVELIDLKGRKKEVLTDKLKQALAENLKNKNQSLLFLNRRGFTSFLLCNDCGHIYECPNCSVSLTMHKGINKLKCHYCDYKQSIPEFCECGSNDLTNPTHGTERLEEVLKEEFPEAVVVRMDRDTTSKKGEMKKILHKMHTQVADILIGTQMVAKGHDYPHITLVGVVSGDTSLNIPDFRSSEKTFQLITQVSGRAGRSEKEGKVFIQTLTPENFVFRCAIKHDYESFYNKEIKEREELNYPPFSRVSLIRLRSLKENECIKTSDMLRTIADTLLEKAEYKKDITVLGPVPSLIARVKSSYRYQLMFKGKDAIVLNHFLRTLINTYKKQENKKVNLSIDIDAQNVF